VGAAARGGQTLLTSTVAKIVEHELPTGGRLRDLGERSLKRLERPERLYALELADLPHTVSPDPAPARVDGRRAAPLLERDAGLAAPLFGESGLGEAPATGDVSFAILHGLYWLAANAALSEPTLLLVDDLHWGDAPSLHWLTFMARRLEGLPLMLAVGSRPPQ